MTQPVDPQQALIYVMVTMAAVDRDMTDRELRRIGALTQNLPVFRDFDLDTLVPAAEACGALLEDENGLDLVLDVVAKSLPPRLYETAYALGVEIAAVDLDVAQEELRLLQRLRDRLELDKLVCAAIERGARARYRTP